MKTPKNRNETILLSQVIYGLQGIANLIGVDIKSTTMSLDDVYNSRKNRKVIFNLGMTPNIPKNKRNRKNTKKRRKQTFCKFIIYINLFYGKFLIVFNHLNAKTLWLDNVFKCFLYHDNTKLCFIVI